MIFAGGADALETLQVPHGKMLFHRLYDSTYRSVPRLLKEDFGLSCDQPQAILQEDTEETEKINSPLITRTGADWMLQNPRPSAKSAEKSVVELDLWIKMREGETASLRFHRCSCKNSGN
jgi:hypothetical protein